MSDGRLLCSFYFFFFNDTATTEIYTLSLHDALPISLGCAVCRLQPLHLPRCHRLRDRKSTRLNSSHANISYAVFCLKKKKNITYHTHSYNKKKNKSKDKANWT